MGFAPILFCKNQGEVLEAVDDLKRNGFDEDFIFTFKNDGNYGEKDTKKYPFIVGVE